MNLNVVRALFADALAQVLDNRVFRILCVLVGIPILLTFLIGFKETEISFLFGWKTISYDDLIAFFTGGNRIGGLDPRQATIQAFQEIIVERPGRPPSGSDARDLGDRVLHPAHDREGGRRHGLLEAGLALRR